MAPLRLPSGLVTRVRLEKSAGQMRDLGAGNILADETLHRRNRQLADECAEALDDRDLGQYAYERLADAVFQKEARLRDVGRVWRNNIARHLDQWQVRRRKMPLL